MSKNRIYLFILFILCAFMIFFYFFWSPPRPMLVLDDTPKVVVYVRKAGDPYYVTETGRILRAASKDLIPLPVGEGYLVVKEVPE